MPYNTCETNRTHGHGVTAIRNMEKYQDTSLIILLSNKNVEVYDLVSSWKEWHLECASTVYQWNIIGEHHSFSEAFACLS